LPEGWAMSTLEYIGDLYCGQSPATEFVNTKRKGTPYITGPDQWDGDELHVDKWTTDPRRTVPDGCIFVTVKGAGVGTIFPGVPGAIGRDIYAFKPAVGVSDSFVRRALEFTVSEIKRNAAGDIPGLSKDHLLKHSVNVPPRDEQKRIIAAIDDLFALSKSARDHLSRLPMILKRFRQAVLAAACSGRLTEDWRILCNPTESGIDLAKKIQQSHDSQGFGHGGQAAPPTEGVHNFSKDGLPDTWAIEELKVLCRPGRPITYGILKPGPDVSGGVPYVRVADFPNDRLSLDGIRRTSAQVANNYRRSALQNGDLLLSIRGTVGRVCRVPAELEGANVTQDTARVSIHLDLSVDYMEMYLRCPSVQKRLQAAMKGVAVRGVNIGDVRVIQVALPPRTEQDEIVRRVNALMRIVEVIEQRLNVGVSRTDKLTQSILGKAFRGELVPTEAELARREGRDYEPASVLLERIKKERESTESVKPRSSKQQTSSRARRAEVSV
jgi:type I restriction enzyme, S subunit